jgi:hypothetical protein
VMLQAVSPRCGGVAAARREHVDRRATEALASLFRRRPGSIASISAVNQTRTARCRASRPAFPLRSTYALPRLL